MSSAAKAFKFTTQSVPFIAINMLNYDPWEVKFMIANLQTTFFYKINSLFMLAASSSWNGRKRKNFKNPKLEGRNSTNAIVYQTNLLHLSEAKPNSLEASAQIENSLRNVELAY